MTVKLRGAERTYVRAVVFGDDDLELVDRALSGHRDALGADEQGRMLVGRWLSRILMHREQLFEQDLLDLAEVLYQLQVLWQSEATVEWWRAQGAPGADDAVEGLARERQLQVERVVELRGVVHEMLREVAR